MAWMAKASLLSGGLLLLCWLGVRRRNGSSVLAQLGSAGEGVGGYGCSGAPVAGAPSLPTVVSLHVLALRVGLRRRILVCVGRIWHCNGRGRLGDWRKYLSHKDLVARRLAVTAGSRSAPGAGDADGDECRKTGTCRGDGVSSGTVRA